MARARTGITEYSTSGDTDFVIKRVLDAPRKVVWAAWTHPKHIPMWLLGPEGWTMPVCELDLRVGGKWRYVWRKGDGTELTLTGIVKEVQSPEKLVMTESWGEPWPETLNTLVMKEEAGQTHVTLTVRYPSKEAREAALKTGASDGMDQGFARLDELLKTLV